MEIDSMGGEKQLLGQDIWNPLSLRCLRDLQVEMSTAWSEA